MGKIAKQPDFSDEYIESCFYSWYRAKEPGLGTMGTPLINAKLYVKNLPTDELGRRPSHLTVVSWMQKYGWKERADALNAEVSIKFDKKVIQERYNDLEKLAKAGKTMLKAGLDYFEKNPNPFADNPSAAVRAIVSASEMIFKYAGAAAKLEAINAMSDRQLEIEIRKLVGTEPPDEDENPTENTIEATLEDIPDQDADESDNT